jgi:hypothetical protein
MYFSRVTDHAWARARDPSRRPPYGYLLPPAIPHRPLRRQPSATRGWGDTLATLPHCQPPPQASIAAGGIGACRRHHPQNPNPNSTWAPPPPLAQPPIGNMVLPLPQHRYVRSAAVLRHRAPHRWCPSSSPPGAVSGSNPKWTSPIRGHALPSQRVLEFLYMSTSKLCYMSSSKMVYY